MWQKVLDVILRRSKRNREAEQTQSELDCLLERAGEFAAKRNIHALEDLQRLVMRSIQSLHMVDAYLKPDHKAMTQFHEWNDIGINHIPGLNNSFISRVTKHPIEKDFLPIAKLGRDIVLPTCWHPSSIVNLLGRIGEERKGSAWSQDGNHKLIYWYPLNIFWVTGGNHSITQGIVLAEGSVTTNEGYDISIIYPHVKFDGTYWLDCHSGARIGKPRYKEFGYVYEIGRLILELK